MSSQRNFEKDPNAILDFTVDWTDWLGSDTIVTGTWIIPSGITEVSRSNTTKISTVFVSGGASGQTYSLVNRINTSGGRTDDRTIFILVTEQ